MLINISLDQKEDKGQEQGQEDCFKFKEYKFKKSFKYFRLKYLKYLYYKYFNILKEGYCEITIINPVFKDHINIITKGYEKCIIKDIKNEIKDARNIKDFEKKDENG